MIPERRSENRHYTLVPERTAVVLDVSTSLGPITFGANGIEGFIEAVVEDGAIDAATSPPAAHLELLVNRMTSGNSAWDSELHRQIGARRYPTAYLDLYAASPLDRPSSFRVHGEVTLRGATVPAEGVVVAELPEPGLLVVSGEDSLNISDFGIPPPSLFMIKIDPEVKIRLYLEARAEPF